MKVDNKNDWNAKYSINQISYKNGSVREIQYPDVIRYYNAPKVSFISRIVNYLFN